MKGAKVCNIDHDTFARLIKTQPDLAWEMIKHLGDRLYGLWEQVSEANNQTIAEKCLA